jgi:hypothetical protein
MTEIIPLNGRNVLLDLEQGQSFRVIGDDFYIAENGWLTRVALHISERDPFAHVVDTIVPLDEPVRA